MNKKKMVLFAFVLCFMLGMSIAGPTDAHSKNKVFAVAPSGDISGLSDTANIQAAINAAVNTGKGSIVYLEAGDFYICETLVGINFDGTMKGAGAGATVLHSIENFPAQDTGNLGLGNPRMLMFYQDESSTSTTKHPCKIELGDFTIKVDLPTEEWYGYRAMNTVDIYGKIVDGSIDDVSYFDATVKNVEFLGDIGDEYGPFGLSIQNALLIQGEWGDFWNEPISGDFLVKGCYFQNSLGSSAMFGSFVDSTVRVIRNTYHDTMIGPEMYELGNSRGEIAFNDVSGCAWFGTYVAHGIGYYYGGPSIEPGQVRIHHNHIEVPAYGNGIWIDDFLAVPGEVQGVSVFAYQNDIVLDGGGAWGIVGSGVQDVWLVHNTISGTGDAGILTGIFGDTVSGWKMVLNDVADLEADVAAVWLGEGTSDCWGLFKGTSDLVWDLGTNNNLHFI